MIWSLNGLCPEAIVIITLIIYYDIQCEKTEYYVPNSNIHSKWRATFKVYMKKLNNFMMHIQTISIIIFYRIVQTKVESLILEQAKVKDHLNWVNTSILLSFLYVYFRCCCSNRNIFMGYFFHLLLLFHHCYISLSSQILQQQFSQSIWQQPIMWRIIHDTRQHLVFHHPGKLMMINVIRSQKEKMGQKHDVIKGKQFPRYWPFVWGIPRRQGIPLTKASDVEL